MLDVYVPLLVDRSPHVSAAVAQLLAAAVRERAHRARVADWCPPAERALAAHNERNSRVHPFLHNFTSPIGEHFDFVGVKVILTLTEIDIMEGQPKRWYVKRQDHLRESII